MFWAAIANDVQHSLSNPDVLVIGHFKNSVPEHVDVTEDLAWAQLLAGLETDVIIFGPGVLEDDVDVLGVPADAENLLLGLLRRLHVLLLIDPALTHFKIIKLL